MNLGIMDDPEKFIAIKSAERDLRLPYPDAIIVDAANLIHHYDKRFVDANVFAGGQPPADGLHTLFA